MFFFDLIFQLQPIINPLILDQLACSLPKTNTTFHQLFKYVKKDAIFSTIRRENNRNIFGQRSLIDTVALGSYMHSSNTHPVKLGVLGGVKPQNYLSTFNLFSNILS